MKKCGWIALLVLFTMAASPTATHAQSARSGPTFRIGGSTDPVILPDVAYDNLRGRYLVVSGNGFIEGQLLDATGRRLQNFVVAQGSLAANLRKCADRLPCAQTPRVIFSGDINGGNGGYFVTWHEGVGSGFSVGQVRGKFISGDGVALSGEIVIAPEAGAPGTGSYWIMGAAIAYSPLSREFLVTWMGAYPGAQNIHFTRLNLAGQLLQGTVPITSGVDWERDPSVAYNPAQDEFYLVYAGVSEVGQFSYVNGQRIKAGTGALIGGPRTFIQTAATYIPAVEYSRTTGHYLVVWYNRTSSSAAFYGVTLGGDGAALSGVRIISSRYVVYDALDVAYNNGNGDFLLVTHSQDYEDAAVSINADGTPYDNGYILTNTPDVRAVLAGDGNFNPRVVSNAGGKFLAVTSSKFAAIHGQFVASSAGGGQQPPPPPGSNPKLFLDSPATNTLVQSNFAIAGWAVDLGSPAGGGTSISTVHAWAHPASGDAAIFLGAATMGVARQDIANYYGRGDFAGAGFGLSATLPPGVYDVIVSAWSTVAGGFNSAASSRITVTTPTSNPKMFIDSPGVGQIVQTQFSVGGWAVDLGAASGAGVSVVHVWAYPASGDNPIFVGATLLNVTRPDVGAHFGNARFSSSGYSLQGTLPPGVYTLVVYARSTVTDTFNGAAVPITVR